ncbi:MAG: FkbM family [Planctomycetota bacterium]|nr:MAG: FkbM family [Planctomycetota bacterium]
MGLFHFVGRIWRHPANRGRRFRTLARATWWELRGRPVTEQKLFGGMRILCRPESGVAGGLVHYSGRPEYHEMGLVAHLLRPGDRFVDVGANAGYYTILAASIVGPSGSVESFEPGLPALARLRENVALNGLGNVRVHECALSDASGPAPFVHDRDTENRLATPADAGAVTVAASRLDEVIGEAPCALVKIDVEGAEMRVLRGAEAMLARKAPPVWLIEVGKRLATFGATEEEMASWLAARGYDAAFYDADARNLRFTGPPWTEGKNVVAVARTERERVSRLLKDVPVR